ncbi:unnamed protein product, partial [Mesocestoides corti]
VTNLEFSFRIRFTSVKDISFNPIYKIVSICPFLMRQVLFLYIDCVVTIPLSVFTLVIGDLLNGKGIFGIKLFNLTVCYAHKLFLLDITNLTVDLPIVVHYNPNSESEVSAVQCIDKPLCEFDMLVENSVSLSPEENFSPPHHAVHFAVVAKNPYISFFESNSKKSLSSMPEEYHVIKERVKDIAHRLRGRFKPYWMDSESGPCYVWPGNPNWTLKKIYGLADTTRTALPATFSVSSDLKLAAITDNQCRVTLIDLHKGIALRFWKGCKEAQTCFVDADEGFAPAGRLPRRGSFMLMYLPYSNTLELWSLIHGPLLKSWSIDGPLRFSVLAIIGNDNLLGLKFSLDLWFPHTKEASDFKRFASLRNWINSKAFKSCLHSDQINTVARLENEFQGFSLPDWFLKALWIVLTSKSSGLLDWISQKLANKDLLGTLTLSESQKCAFQKHLNVVRSLIAFYQSLSEAYERQSLQGAAPTPDSTNAFITPVASLFRQCVKASELPKLLPPSVFFRAAAHTRLFRPAATRGSQASKGQSYHKCAAYEAILGRAIFAPYFQGTVPAKSFLLLIDTAPIPFDYLLITQLTEVLYKRHPRKLALVFVELYQIILSSRNYACGLAICSALIGAAEEPSLHSQASSDVDDDVDTSPVTSPLQASRGDLQLRAEHLQDMVVFHHCLTAFRQSYSPPSWNARACSVRRILQSGPGEFAATPHYFTNEFARHLAPSRLKPSELVDIYRYFGGRNSPPCEKEFADHFHAMCQRLPLSFEVNRVLVCAAWRLVRQLASPWTRLGRAEKFSHLSRVADFLSNTSNAGHGLAFVVASQCHECPLPQLLKQHSTSLQSNDFTKPVNDAALLQEAMSLCQFFKEFRQVSIAANEGNLLLRDERWDSRQRLVCPGGELQESKETRPRTDSAFPLDKVAAGDGDAGPPFHALDAWFQFSVIHAAILALGLPDDEPARCPVHLLSAAQWEDCNGLHLPVWTHSVHNANQKSPPMSLKQRRRAFLDWLLRGLAGNANLRTEYPAFLSSAFSLASAWDLPTSAARLFYVVSLYENWADRDAEESRSMVRDSYTLANSLFYVLAARICEIDKQMSGRILVDASENLAVFLSCLKSDASLTGSQPSFVEQTQNAWKLIDFLIEHLPVESNQRVFTLELRDLLQEALQH